MGDGAAGRRDELDHFATWFEEVKHGDREKSECISEIEDQGYEYLGGSTRNVFLMPDGDFVVKFTTNPVFNRREVEKSAEGIDVLVPVTAHSSDYRWLTMPVVETRSYRDTPWEDVQTVKDGLAEAGWKCKDIRRDNIGYLDGEPVAFDYAEGCERV